MRSRRERAVLTALAAALVAAAVAAWWTVDLWWPQTGPWTAQAWKKITRPGVDTLPPAMKRPTQAHPAQPGASEPTHSQSRKCLKDGRITYTDQPCPKDSQELPVDGAVTSLPR